MCNACAVAEAVRLRPMVCIGVVAPVWMISTFALWALWRGIYPPGGGAWGKDIEKEEFDGD